MTSEIQKELYPYLAGIIQKLGSAAVIINGVADYVHMLVSYKSKMMLSDFMRELKSSSSRWIHQRFPALNDFAWQEGYSAFSVSQSATDDVKRYIQRQPEHHQKMDFLEELKRILELHHVDYDPKYLP